MLNRGFEHPALVLAEELERRADKALGSRWIAGWCQQEADQRPQQPLAAGTCVVHELEEAQVQRQGLLRDPAVRTEPRPQQRPESLQGVDMDLAEPVPV